MSRTDHGAEVAGLGGTVADAAAAMEAALVGRRPVGVGIDVEDVDRWRTEELRWDALFSPDELAYCASKADKARHLAGFWCIKEAAFKALASHMTLSLRDITVAHRRDGSVYAVVRGVGPAITDRLLVSVSHTKDAAAAIAVYLAD